MKQIVQGLWEIDEIGDDVHSYLWEWPGGLTLIDTGYAKDADTILKALVAHGYPVHTIRRIIVTHGAPDHAGGLKRIKRETRAEIVCHAVEKETIEHPLRKQPGPLWWRLPMAIIMAADSGRRMQGVSPNELVVDGQELPEGFVVVHTPGCAPGHISLLHPERRLLIAGDALSIRDGKLRSPNGFGTPDPENASRSLWKLAKKYGDDFEQIVFGHGPPLLANGGKRVKGLASQIFSAAI